MGTILIMLRNVFQSREVLPLWQSCRISGWGAGQCPLQAKNDAAGVAKWWWEEEGSSAEYAEEEREWKEEGTDRLVCLAHKYGGADCCCSEVMAGSRSAVGYYNREKLPARIHTSPLPHQLLTCEHTHKSAHSKDAVKVWLPYSLSLAMWLVMGKYSLLMSDQAGLQEETEAVLPGTGEDCRNREGGREGGREVDAVSQSATQAWRWLQVIWWEWMHMCTLDFCTSNLLWIISFEYMKTENKPANVIYEGIWFISPYGEPDKCPLFKDNMQY